VTKFLP